jgi:hypothetical protein
MRDIDSNMKGSWHPRDQIVNYYKEKCVRSFENENSYLWEPETNIVWSIKIFYKRQKFKPFKMHLQNNKALKLLALMKYLEYTFIFVAYEKNLNIEVRN